MLSKLCSDRSRAWKLTPSTHPRAVQKTWTIWNRYGYRYSKICIFPTVSLSNGRRLTRLRDIRTSYGKRGVWGLTLLSYKVTSRGRWGMIFAIVSAATNEHNSVNCNEASFDLVCVATKHPSWASNFSIWNFSCFRNLMGCKLELQPPIIENLNCDSINSLLCSMKFSSTRCDTTQKHRII